MRTDMIIQDIKRAKAVTESIWLRATPRMVQAKGYS